MPRSDGAGNSNTGNVARKAFQNEETFARITGVDEVLIHRIHVMLVVINTDQAINVESFKAYGLATAKLWVTLYGWCKMPVTMHQLFFHAWESLRLSSLPLSFFSEQSLESCNKFFKRDREHHSRKDASPHYPRSVPSPIGQKRPPHRYQTLGEAEESEIQRSFTARCPRPPHRRRVSH